MTVLQHLMRMFDVPTTVTGPESDYKNILQSALSMLTGL